jgi:hypothetical protein
MLMKTRGCSFQEAAEHFEKLPDRALEASRRLINPIRASAVSGAKPMEVAASCLARAILVRRKYEDVSIRLTEKARPARYRSRSDA